MDFNSLKDTFLEKWEQPKIRYSIVGVFVFIAICFIAFNTNDIDTGGKKKVKDINGKTHVVEKKRNVDANFFSEKGADVLEQNRMNEVYSLMQDQLADREKETDEKEEEMRQMESRMMKELDALKFTQNEMKRQFDVQRSATAEALKAKQNQNKPKAFGSHTQKQRPQRQAGGNNVNMRASNRQATASRPMGQAVNRMMPKVLDHKRVGIRTISSTTDTFQSESGKVDDLKTGGEKPKEVKNKPLHKDKEPKKDEIFVPAGSIISGVLITGMDVPTGNSVRNDPFPAILRIKKEALLPNNFTADIRECVIIASGFGDIASRRAYLRAEAISCVNEEGKAVEANLSAFAVGGDGRNGIPGRLVSKNGEAAMKSAWAGFLSGMADLAGTSTYNIGDDETGVFSATENPEILKSMTGTAAFNGAGEAMERMADYYIEIAEQMKPYIEVNPGIEIDFIVNHGSKIAVN